MNDLLNEEEVSAAIAAMPSGSAAGHDGVPAELVKAGGSALASLLTKLFNLAWTSGERPSQWRQGVVVSIFKKGSRTDPGNYRPITLLPVLDKLFMTVLTKRLHACVPLHDHQFAFRKQRGTTDALFCISEIIRLRADQGLETYAFFQDVSKAYDTVWHDGLMYKLHAKGIGGRMWQMIRGMYKGATSAPRLDGQEGDRYDIRQGVAQGCPMSPVLFDIFIDDLLHEMNSSAPHNGLWVTAHEDNAEGAHYASEGYADDISALADSPAKLQLLIDHMAKHGRLWRYAANTDKSKAMVFARGASAAAAAAIRHAHTWTHEGRPIQLVSSYKQLGLMMSADCSWREQGKSAMRRLHGAFHAWKPALASPAITVQVKLHVIRTFIKPAAAYAMEVWAADPGDRATADLITKMDVALRRALRLALGLPSGATMRFLPSELLHSDAAVRCFRDEIAVAHLRLMRKLEENTHGIALAAAVYEASRQSPLAPQNRQRLQSWWARAAAFKAQVEQATGWEDLFAPPCEGADDADAAPDGPAPRLSNRQLNAAVHTLRKRTQLASAPQHLQVYLQSGTAVCAHYLASGLSQQAGAVFALRAGLLPADLAQLSHLVAPVPGVAALTPAFLACPDCGVCTADEFDPVTLNMDDAACRRRRLQLLLQHRLSECAVNVAARRWLRTVLRTVLGAAVTVELLGTEDYDGSRVSSGDGAWRLRLADSLSSAWDLLDAEALTAANSAAFYRALGAFLRGLTLHGAALPPLRLFGVVADETPAGGWVMQAGWDAWSGSDSDDEVQLVPLGAEAVAGHGWRSFTCLRDALPSAHILCSHSQCTSAAGRVAYVPPGWR
jgi:hypothetical protein